MSFKTFVKRAIKAILPYGITVIYRRIRFKQSRQESLEKQQRDRAYSTKIFTDVYLETTADGNKRFNFNGAFLPDVSSDEEKLRMLRVVYGDSFMFSCLFNDNYDAPISKIMDLYMGEGPYGYTDGSFDVTVKTNDVVIDAGAWIGDFSAYAAHKGAEVYAFEPTTETFIWLEKTAELNKPHKIHPVKKGLGNCDCSLPIYLNEGNSGGNTVMIQRKNIFVPSETINITSLDKFVEENNIKKVDFIKADIEGAERDMLKGAVNVLKNFAPKLAICTYHLFDDPVVLERIIKDANPKYKVAQLRHKLFASVME